MQTEEEATAQIFAMITSNDPDDRDAISYAMAHTAARLIADMAEGKRPWDAGLSDCCAQMIDSWESRGAPRFAHR